ncbi:MAG TPA: acetylxylan esterase, partial [Planctomycetota bacterium]|nr:acetylxylan esterase [Planctomycetota bacterium]
MLAQLVASMAPALGQETPAEPPTFPSSIDDPLDASMIARILAAPLLPDGVAHAEIREYVRQRISVFPAVESLADWEVRAERMRDDILERVVFRGEAARWREAKGRVEWLETIEGAPGVRIRKLRFEALPGLWIPALLYEPATLEGKVPVVLNVNGHDPVGKAAAYKQIRCLNQAKRGMLALNVEWIGMGQLRTPGFSHARMNQLDLCGASGLAPFYLCLERAIDLLLAHEHADPSRLAVAGLSGGGWQTIWISALDERVTLANP